MSKYSAVTINIYDYQREWLDQQPREFKFSHFIRDMIRKKELSDGMFPFVLPSHLPEFMDDSDDPWQNISVKITQWILKHYPLKLIKDQVYVWNDCEYHPVDATHLKYFLLHLCDADTDDFLEHIGVNEIHILDRLQDGCLK